MKNIFFYSNHREYDPTIGITQKVHGEIRALRAQGYTVYYSAYTKNGVGIYNNDNELVYQREFVAVNPKIIRIIRRQWLLDCCSSFVANTPIKFSYGYLRFHFFDHKYTKLLKTLKSTGSYIIVEAHAYPYRLWSIKKIMWPTYILDVLYENKVKKYIDIVAVMGNEQKPWGIEAIQIDNGIDIDRYPLKKNCISQELKLISVSNEHTGHAYHKVVNGLADYYSTGGKKNITIHLVGEYLESTKKLIEEKGLTNHFVFWGKKHGEELDVIFNQSDLGLGAFSHRSDDSGSCIKTKEYFARGIPFLNGWKEPAFDDSYPYVLRFDTKNEIIDFHRVLDFYDNLGDLDYVSKEMRLFAESHYTWEMQMKKIFQEVEKRQ